MSDWARTQQNQVQALSGKKKKSWARTLQTLTGEAAMLSSSSASSVTLAGDPNQPLTGTTCARLYLLSGSFRLLSSCLQHVPTAETLQNTRRLTPLTRPPPSKTCAMPQVLGIGFVDLVLHVNIVLKQITRLLRRSPTFQVVSSAGRARKHRRSKNGPDW